MKIDSDAHESLRKLGEKIRQHRLNKGWTLEEAEEHGWPAWRHLQKIETGKNFTVATLFKVCQLLKIKPSDLLKGIE